MSILNLKRCAFAATALLMAIGLGACTTVEGTNALVDASTFEREVATETLQGLGLIGRESKPTIETPRAPLVLPKDSNALPAPRTANNELLPEDSDTVQIDVSNISEEDLRRLRNARVVDLRSKGGRPLTEIETRQLTARMTAAQLTPSRGSRPLYLPPDEYFTTVGGLDLICLAANGDLVPLDDPSCPPEIRAALQ